MAGKRGILAKECSSGNQAGAGRGSSSSRDPSSPDPSALVPAVRSQPVRRTGVSGLLLAGRSKDHLSPTLDCRGSAKGRERPAMAAWRPP